MRWGAVMTAVLFRESTVRLVLVVHLCRGGEQRRRGGVRECVSAWGFSRFRRKAGCGGKMQRTFEVECVSG